MTLPSKRKHRNRTLFSVIFLSLLLHLFGLYLLKDYTFVRPVFFMPKQHHLGEDSFDLYSNSIQKKNQDLENIFSRLIAKPILPNDVKFDFKDLDSSFIQDEKKKFKFKEITPDKNSNYLSQNSFEINLEGEMNLLNTLSSPNERIESFYEPSSSNDLLIETEYLDTTAEAKNVFEQLSLVDLVDTRNLAANFDPNLQPINLNEPTLASSENTFSESDNLNTNRILASSSDFMVNLEYAPQFNEDGFIFKISLIPKPYKHFKRIKQNFFFLIDRSHSISLKNYQAAKDAVALALDHLQPEDTFNILFFDGKVVKFSEKNISWNPKNISLAKQFLKNQKHGGFFASTDLYSSLDKIIPEAVQEDEVNTAILLSDGDTYINKQKQRKTLNFWSQKNKGKVSLFTIAIGKKNNLPLLDLLSIFNKGSLRIAACQEKIPSELLNLIQAIKAPIGKDLIITALPHKSHAKIQVFPTQERLPNLYENLEYVIYGTINQASDFTLFLQGRYYDHWLDIKKSISLTKGTLSEDSSLKKGILLQRAYGEYEQYLRSGHPGFLDKAKKLLQPIQIPIAFE